MKKPEKSPHRLRHEERSACIPIEVRTLGKGDVCVRQGAPHMIVELSNDARIAYDSEADAANAVWVCNLQTGSVWPISGSEQVFPATDVVLDYTSARRGDLS